MANYPPVISGIVENFKIDVDDPNIMFNELSITDVYLQESILSPSLQISVTLHDTVHLVKNYFQYKVRKGEMPKASFVLKNPMFDVPDDVPIGGEYRGQKKDVELPIAGMVVYRMDNRKPVNYHTEEFTLHMCQPATVQNLKARMSDFYKTTELSKIVQDGLKAVGSIKNVVEATNTKRDYISNNQHPYQVISEIADMASLNGRVQFLHYMTSEDATGIQYFQPMKKLINAGTVFDFYYNEKGVNQQLTDPSNIMTYEFPCDFDTLLDLSGGIIHNKQDYNNHKPSMVSMNPFDGGMFLVDGKIHGDRKTQGFGGTLNAGAWSNLKNFESNAPYGSSSPLASGIGGAITGAATGGFAGALSGALGGLSGGGQLVGAASRPSRVEKYLHRRTEVLSFFHRENVNLKIVVPFNPKVHVGKMINVFFQTKRDAKDDFGSGKYLICHLTHNIKVGSFGVTTLECIKIEDKSNGYKEIRPDHQILKKMPGL